MLRAWRSIDRFEPRPSLNAWLYRIATNVCLRMLEQRNRRPQAAVDAHLEPYPDQLLERVPSSEADPEAALVEAETVGLAFVTAMQLLTPKQRVAVVLRDALGWSARDVATLLDETVPAVNSALQRGRARLEQERDERIFARAHQPVDQRTEELVMKKFRDAWARVDIDGIVALLTDDALLTMPPEAARFEGSAAIGAFFATIPMDGNLDQIVLLPTTANGQPALAAYAAERPEEALGAYGVMVFAIDGDRITGITGFPRRPDLFTRLGLATELDPGTRT